MNGTIKLTDAIKGYTHDQDKLVPPEETVRRFKEKTAATGLEILDRTRRIDTGRLDIPVFFSECGSDARQVIGTRKQMGKGGTPAQAEASAVMELAERFSFFSFMADDRQFVQAPVDTLDGPVLGFDQIIRSVHDTDADALAVKPVFDRLPLRWTRGIDLTRGTGLWIPFNWFYMINEFNGPSAGNCTEEALVQGICEVVERHTCARVSHEHLQVPGIRLESFTDPVVQALLAKYRQCGIQVHASDFSLDTGIATIAVMAWDPTTFPDHSEIVWTAGTAPDPRKAMIRALTEVAQLAGDFNTDANYVASGLPKLTRVEDTDWITHPEAVINAADLPDLSDANIRREVEALTTTLARNGLSALAIDIRHPALDIPAVYTILPGAHFRERAAAAGVGMFAARLITDTHDPVQALSRLAELETALPGTYYTPFHQGLAHVRLMDLEAALSAFETAMAREPARLNLPDICSHMGACLKDLGRHDAAIETCRNGLAVDPRRPDLLNTMGVCAFMKKDHQQAIAWFEQALEIDPSQAINYANIGSNYRELGKIPLALKYYEMALEIDPTIDFARDNIERLTKDP